MGHSPALTLLRQHCLPPPQPAPPWVKILGPWPLLATSLLNDLGYVSSFLWTKGLPLRPSLSKLGSGTLSHTWPHRAWNVKLISGKLLLLPKSSRRKGQCEAGMSLTPL